MDTNNVYINFFEFLNDYKTSNKRKRLKINNTIVLLENGYLKARKSIKTLINAIKEELTSELDVAYQTKLQILLDFQKEVEEYVYSNLLNVFNDFHCLRDIVRIIENSSNKVCILPYISLDFIPEDISIAKSAIGYFKTCAVLPEELTLTLFELDDKYWLEVRSSKPWHSLLIYSLTTFAENFAGRKFYGNVIDKKNGFYSITFQNNFGIDFKVSVLLCARHVRNSPLTIKNPLLRSPKYGSYCLDTSASKTVEMPNKNETIPKLFIQGGICSSFCTENDEKKSFKVTGMGRGLVAKEEVPKKFLATRGKVYSSGECTGKVKVSLTEGLNVGSVINGKDWFSPVERINSNSDIKAEGLINMPTANKLSPFVQNKSNGTDGTDWYKSNETERSEWDKSTSANRKDKSKISTTADNVFWSSQTVENLDGSTRDNSPYARKSLNNTDDDDDEENFAAVTAKLTHVISSQCGVDLKYPVGVVVSDNKDIVICDTGNHRVWILDETGKRKALFNTTDQGKRLCRPSAAVMLQNGILVIKDDNSLHFYDSNGTFIKSTGNEILNKSFGLVLTENEKLVTLSESRSPKLFVFNKDAQLEHICLYQPILDRPENSKCRFMATYNNELVVSDLGLSKMYKTNLLGEQIHVFGSYGKTPGNFNEPSGITLDSSDTMLIGDSKNDRIQIFSWNGEYLGRVLFSDPIRRPSDITLTFDGYLYVLNYLDHFLGIYKLENDK
ncbi:uncharacterized protein LOC111631279 isoform X2 [Centruroides sculpturatus]|uniref:uncharacterized protein LOC111631279 isoform X2 n=1 Tax=Centruroides sculpturatus TaxID=218467 RepID=UPI000C6CAC10|nr:uncharacterized protein LOC111631279 isoform X2 [Centruroides sculpturatus]